MRKRSSRQMSVEEELFPGQSSTKCANSVYIPDYNKKNVMVVADTLFRHLDGKGAGFTDEEDDKLTWGEFALLCRYIGAKDDVAIRRLWIQTDKDGNGWLDRREFLIFCARKEVYPLIGKAYVAVRNRQVEAKMRRVAADELFRFLDKDNSGTLSWEEFLPLCKGAGSSAKQAQEGWAIADSDENGELSLEEFRTFVASELCWPAMRQMHLKLMSIKGRNQVKVSQDIFNELKASKSSDKAEQFDENELTFEQFAKLCKRAGALTEERARKIFEMTDQDHSGSISRKEFAIFCRRNDVWPTIQKIHNHILDARRAKQAAADQKSNAEAEA